jgi:cell division protein FtsQ
MNAFLRLVAWLLAIVLVTLPVVAVIQGWAGAERWPLRRVQVVGNHERVDATTVRDTVLPFAQRGFFAVRLDDAQSAVSRLPWIEQAEVRKQWPDVLVVRVVEHRPFAWWGEDHLLSERGRIFPSKGVAVPKGLPHFDGPESRSADLVELYNESRAMFAAEGLDVRALRIDPRGSWSMTLSNGAELLVGRDDAKLRLARFARLLPQLAQQGRQLDRADLRYTNGFALRWASGREQADADKASAAAGERPAMDGRAGRSGAAMAAPGMAANIRTTNPESRFKNFGSMT